MRKQAPLVVATVKVEVEVAAAVVWRREGARLLEEILSYNKERVWTQGSKTVLIWGKSGKSVFIKRVNGVRWLEDSVK
jgi:archaeosine-15-forming tRNA-guanine transglycosylase